VLPALTIRARRIPRLRLLSGVASAGLLAIGVLGSVPGPADRPAHVAPLAQRLAPASWGFAVPTTWFAVPLTDLHVGDRIDVLSLRAGERPAAAAIAFDLEVMAIDERSLVINVSAGDATAIATARAGGQLIVPLLRSTR